MQTARKNQDNSNLISRLLISTSLTRTLIVGAAATVSALAATPALAVDALETPTGANIQGGSATFDSLPGNLTVNQTSDRLFVDWNTFNIGHDASTVFVQPDALSIAVNRVVGPMNAPTQILGSLKANGTVVVLDKNGVVFGKDAKVDVGGIVASTGDLDVDSVMNGADNRLHLTGVDTGAMVDNQGQITVTDGGLAALVAPSVRNKGVITARLGRAALAAGDKVTLDLYGDNLINMEVTGTAKQAIIAQEGTINAEGGLIQISASAAKDVVNNVVNLTGVTDVSSVTMDGGRIVLSGGTVNAGGTTKADGVHGGSIKVTAEKNVNVTGNLSTVSADTSSTRGKITVDAARFKLTSGQVNAGVGDIAINNTGGFQATANSLKTSGAGSITLNQNKDSDASLSSNTIQNAINAVSNSGTGTNTINVGAGTYNEAVTVNKSVQLKGANAGVAGTAVRGAETVINTWAPGFTVTANNASIDGFSVKNAVQGVYINGADHTTVANNIITNTTSAAVLGVGATHALISGNLIDGTGTAAAGVSLSAGSHNSEVEGNTISHTGGRGVSIDSSNKVKTVGNAINNTLRSGIYYFNSTGGSIIGNAVGYTAVGGVSAGANNIAGDGIRVEQAKGGESSTTVVTKNNVTDTLSTGGDIGSGVHVYNSNFVVVHDNTLTNAGWDDVRVDLSNFVNVQNNALNGAARTGLYVGRSSNVSGSYNSGSGFGWYGAHGYQTTDLTLSHNDLSDSAKEGVYLYEMKGTTNISDNNIENTGAHGISVDSFSGYKILGNSVYNTQGDGIRVFNSWSTGAINLIQGNNVSDTHSTGTDIGSGIHVLYANKVNVLNNVVTDSGWDNIRLFDTRDAYVGHNSVSGATRTGIFGGLDRRTVVELNDVSESGMYGIHGWYGTDMTVKDNSVSRTGLEGIYMLGLLGKTSVTGNGVQGTGSHGIMLKNLTNFEVSDNEIGSVEGRIKGDGIRVEDSYNSADAHGVISGNTISYTRSPRADDGSGIQLRRVGNVDITDNAISNTAWDSIRLQNLEHVTISGNTLSDAARTGIYGSDIWTVGINGNDISNDGMYGVEVNYGHNLTLQDNALSGTGLNGFSLYNQFGSTLVDGNTVDNTGGHGIYVRDVNDLTVTGNTVGSTDGGIGSTGIYVSGADSALIEGNTVTNAQGDGIAVVDSFYMPSLAMVVADEGSQPASGTTGIIGNTVSDVGGDGIYTENLSEVEIGDNTVSNAGNAGVHVGGSVYGDVSVHGNTVSDTPVGMYFETGLIDLTGDANTLIGGDVGYRFGALNDFPFPPFETFGKASFYAPARVDLVNNTIGTTVFSGQSTYYVELLGGALFDPGQPTQEDGLSASYDGFVPASVGGILNEAEYDALEAKFWHYIDDSTVGQFFFGTLPTFEVSSAYRSFSAFNPAGGRAGFTITGLPRLPGAGAAAAANLTNPADLNNLAPAAGGDLSAEPTADEVASLAPAAGGTPKNASCWADTASLAGVTPVSYDFSTDASAALSDAATCGTNNTP